MEHTSMNKLEKVLLKLSLTGSVVAFACALCWIYFVSENRDLAMVIVLIISTFTFNDAKSKLGGNS